MRGEGTLTEMTSFSASFSLKKLINFLTCVCTLARVLGGCTSSLLLLAGWIFRQKRYRKRGNTAQKTGKAVQEKEQNGTGKGHSGTEQGAKTFQTRAKRYRKGGKL